VFALPKPVASAALLPASVRTPSRSVTKSALVLSLCLMLASAACGAGESSAGHPIEGVVLIPADDQTAIGNAPVAIRREAIMAVGPDAGPPRGAGVVDSRIGHQLPVHARTTMPEDLSSRLQRALDNWAELGFHYGVSAAVILNDGSEWVGASGTEAMGSRLQPDHLIWIASITKTMTGAVIMRLAQDDWLGLDDPISRWLPDLTNIDPEITVRQLLNHTNGLENYTKSPELWARVNADRAHVFRAEELIAHVGPAAFPPGARTQYTNTSFVLLGLIAERVTGRSMVELYHEELWEPLGLDQIFLPGFGPPPAPVATAWRLTRESTESMTPLEEMSSISTGSYAYGLFSDARTVARWGRELFAGELLGDDMRNEMLEFVPAAGNIPGESGAGLAIRKYDFFGRVQWGHSGGSPLGSSLLIHDPESQITVAVLMNQGARSDHFRLAPELLEIAATAGDRDR